MKRLTVRQWADALCALVETSKESELKKQLAAFGVLVNRRRAGKLLPRILARFEATQNERAGVVTVHTVAARELSKPIIESLESLGKTVVINHTIDPQVVGGMKMQVGDVIIDGTVSRALKKLYEN